VCRNQLSSAPCNRFMCVFKLQISPKRANLNKGRLCRGVPRSSIFPKVQGKNSFIWKTYIFAPL
jgi:hypothetical protein